MREGWVQWREGDNLHDQYTNSSGQVVRATWFGWFSRAQQMARKDFSERLAGVVGLLMRRAGL